MTGTDACDACLRHSWLVARLSGRIEVARHDGRRLREVLALPPDVLIEALAGREREAVAAGHAAPDLPDRARAAVAAAGQLALCRHAAAYPPRLLDLDDAPAVLHVLLPAAAAGQPATPPPAARQPVAPPPAADRTVAPPPVVPQPVASPSAAAQAMTRPSAVAQPGPSPSAADLALARLTELAGGPADSGARAVAVVGTRRASAEGLEVARGLGRGLSAAGVTVVSGMALGVDAAAHAGALEHGGRTIAVLACGADVAYPRRKVALHRAIADAGLVVSELPPGSAPRRWTFPARNRIIAALGQMVLVVEAAIRSGSLITAECAADLGREVAAVPGPVLSWRADGTNALLRDGATLVRHSADVLDAVVGLDRPPAGAPAVEPRLRAVLHAVAGGRDTVAALAGTPDRAERALRDLTELELLGVLRRAPGGRYVVVAR